MVGRTHIVRLCILCRIRSLRTSSHCMPSSCRMRARASTFRSVTSDSLLFFLICICIVYSVSFCMSCQVHSIWCVGSQPSSRTERYFNFLILIFSTENLLKKRAIRLFSRGRVNASNKHNIISYMFSQLS